jgi:tetratricopeptide (TPR) repeat protein
MAETYFSLGCLFYNQSKLALAEQMFKQALQSKETALGAEHTLTHQVIESIGILYLGQGRLALAEQMFKQAL